MQYQSFSAEIVRTDHCSDRIYDQHCHTRYEILYVLKGSMHLNLEGRQLRLEEGSGVVVSPLKYHVVTGNNEAYHRLIIFLNSDSIAEEIFEKFQMRTEQGAVFHSHTISKLFDSFCQIWEKDDDAFAPLLQAILTQVVYALTFENTSLPEKEKDKNTQRLQQIITYIENNLDKELILSDLARRLYLSESSLCHLFRQEMKISLKQYILQKKMSYARSLLYQGVTPRETASRCGYKNYASFYKIFLKATGRTPAQIKE